MFLVRLNNKFHLWLNEKLDARDKGRDFTKWYVMPNRTIVFAIAFVALVLLGNFFNTLIPMGVILAFILSRQLAVVDNITKE